MSVKGGRLELLVPHIVRGQLFRPGFVRLSLRLGAARQMPAWAKLQFTNGGVSPGDLDEVLGRIRSLESWVDEWQALGRRYETAGQDALAQDRRHDATRAFLSASAAYCYAQFVVFLDIDRKRLLHEACVRAFAAAAPLMDPPAQPFEVTYRNEKMHGYLRVPPGATLAPVVVIFNGTNAVKEELHLWAESLLERGLAVITFDGPGMGETFRRITMLATPRSVGAAILNTIETHPELDPDAVAFMGLSLGGYMAIRMAATDSRIKAVAAVSPPYAASIYWNVTLAAMRRELAALYGITEAEMGASIERVTLEGVVERVQVPMMISGGGHDHLTPGSEAWKIFEEARCEREMVFYPRGAHECFNVLADLRPRTAGWLSRQLEKHRSRVPRPQPAVFEADGCRAGEAVDPDFGDALCGDVLRPVWNLMRSPGLAARWTPWSPKNCGPIEVVCRSMPGNGHANGTNGKRLDVPTQLAGDAAF